MAVVRISDVVVPTVFAAYTAKDTMQRNAFYNTGAFRQDAALAANLAGGGRTFNVPFFKDLDDTESDTASDDPDSDAIPGKLGTGTDVAVRQVRTKGWSTTDLTRELAGADPLARISESVARYWSRQFDAIAVATLRGVIADNIANDSGDMVKDISNDNAPPILAAEKVSAEAIMDAAQTLGDEKEALKLIVMHSVVNTELAKQDLITFRPDSTGKIMVPYYLGYRVMVSDQAAAIAGANRVKYHTYLLGEGAIGWAEDPLPNGVAVDRDESAADGMGVEELWTRKQFAIHVYGVKWTDSAVGGLFPTNAELRNAANYDRVYAQRKQIPLAVLVSNG